MTTTFKDLIDKTFRRLEGSTGRAVTCNLSTAVGAGAFTLNLSGPAINAPSVGGTLAIDMEVFLVTNYQATTGVATVQPGYLGSLPAAHTQGSLVYVNPRFTRFDIGVAINDDLSSLSSPTNGLFRIPDAAAITYNPVFMGYDLGGLPDDFIDILEVRYKIAFPSRNFPLIKRWKIARNLPDSDFPSKRALIIYEDGWPGLPIYVSYSAAFVPFVNLTDDAVDDCGLPATAVDLPPLGAEIDLTLPQEIKRNTLGAQDDPRRATEVPPGAVSNSVVALMKHRQDRINEEGDRLAASYRRTRW